MGKEKDIIYKYKTLEDELDLFSKEDLKNYLVVKETMNEGPTIDLWYCSDMNCAKHIFNEPPHRTMYGTWEASSEDADVSLKYLLPILKEEFPKMSWNNEPINFSIKLNV